MTEIRIFDRVGDFGDNKDVAALLREKSVRAPAFKEKRM